jgi:hypothetical protein
MVNGAGQLQCDNCVGDIPLHFYLQSVRYGHTVDLCSPACFHTITYVWNMDKRQPMVTLAGFLTLASLIAFTLTR